jgi:PadR family transcriptional regulator PadR
MPRPRTDLLQGTLDLIILRLLAAGPTNGWDLTQRIRATSRDILDVNAGSLYPALYRLESRGLIRAEWQVTDNNRRARAYSLTRTGRRELAARRATWERFVDAMSAILAAPEA